MAYTTGSIVRDDALGQNGPFHAVDLEWRWSEVVGCCGGMMLRNFMVAAVVGLGVAGIGVLSACGRASRKPADAAIAGTWVLQSKSTLSVVKRMGREPKDPRIVFAADGRFTAVDLPMEDPFHDPKYRLFTGEGRWRLEEQNGWMLSLTIDRGGYPMFFDDGGESPKVIYTFVDGPDSGERWSWEKQGAGAPR